MKAQQYKKISKSPKIFFDSIPVELHKNIYFRKDLHTYLCTDKEARIDFLANCFFDPAIFFNTTLWCPNPRGKTGSRNVPFILYPHQVPAVRELKSAIDNGYDVNIDKSRDEGATFLMCGIDLFYWLIQEQFTILLGSRIEDLVDKSTEIQNHQVIGNEQSLFYKILYLFNSLPIYLQPKYRKSHMFLQNIENGSSFSGQATSMGFGKGSRASVIAVDELAAIEPKIAQAIIENIADVSGCCIFNSTQGDWGDAHPYAKMLKDPQVHRIVLDWKENPKKKIGLYKSPKEGLIEIYDIDYYRKHWPKVFKKISPNTVIKLQDVENTYPFVADGGVSCFNSARSVWFDKELQRPGRTLRGAAQNILRIPAGSSDLFFQFQLTEKLKDQTKRPYYYGDIEYSLNDDGEVGESWFTPGFENSIFVWWGDLPQRRPFQGHNYVVGCDLSKGTGTSNSVASVLDVNTNEIIGMMVTPYYSVSDFAEKVVALCYWIGGNELPLLVWEENGCPDFYKRVMELGYYNMFTKEKRGKKLKTANKHGWRSTAGPNGTKVEVLNLLDAALHEGLRDNPRFKPLKLYDTQTITELESYVWFEGKIDVGLSSMQTETSGAKAAHGDRVMSVAIANKGREQQQPGSGQVPQMYKENCWAARRKHKEEMEAKRQEDSKVWWY